MNAIPLEHPGVADNGLELTPRKCSKNSLIRGEMMHILLGFRKKGHKIVYFDLTNCLSRRTSSIFLLLLHGNFIVTSVSTTGGQGSIRVVVVVLVVFLTFSFRLCKVNKVQISFDLLSSMMSIFEPWLTYPSRSHSV